MLHRKKGIPVKYALSMAAAVSALVATLAIAPAAAAASRPIWTGYIDVGHEVTWRSVTADFKIPAIGCTSQNSKASFWIGIWGGGTIEQVGISTDCHAAEPSVQAWLEMYPKATDYKFRAFPGDSIAMSVIYNASSKHYSLAVKDLSRPTEKFNLSFACPSGDTCRNINAGAILEADGGTNLSSFSPTGFTAFQAITNTGTRTGLAASGFWGLAKTVMTGQNGKPLASLSAITGNGKVFSLTYKQPR
jgi:peptidase A4-like protein